MAFLKVHGVTLIDSSGYKILNSFGIGLQDSVQF